jgi:hypothetical protein
MALLVAQQVRAEERVGDVMRTRVGTKVITLLMAIELIHPILAMFELVYFVLAMFGLIRDRRSVGVAVDGRCPRCRGGVLVPGRGARGVDSRSQGFRIDFVRLGTLLKAQRQS